MDVATDRRGGAPHAAAARRRRLPRHDAHRRRPSRRSGPTSSRQPRRDPRRARRVPRRARSACASIVAAGRPRRAARRCSSGRAPRAATCRSGASMDDRPRRAAHPGARPPGVHRRGHDARRPARRQHRRLRDRALARRRRAVCSCSSSPPTDADAFEAGLHDARLPRRRGPMLRVSNGRCRTSSRSAACARCAAACGCRATSRSRTARCCSRRSPTAAARSRNLATGDDVQRDARRARSSSASTIAVDATR